MRIKVNYLTVLIALLVVMAVVAGLITLGVKLLDSTLETSKTTGLILSIGGLALSFIVPCAALAIVNFLADIEYAQEKE